MSNVACPYCKQSVEPDDHYKSGPYECPECLTDFWLEVEYNISFDASCMEGDHLLIKDEALSVKHGQTVMFCARCNACVIPDAMKEVTK